MDTDNFMVYIKIYVGIAKDVKTRIDTSNCELEEPLPKGENKKNCWINEG